MLGRSAMKAGLWMQGQPLAPGIAEENPCRRKRARKTRLCGGETGIRTLGGLAPTTVFETAPFDHSGTSPRPWAAHVGRDVANGPRTRKRVGARWGGACRGVRAVHIRGMAPPIGAMPVEIRRATPHVRCSLRGNALEICMFRTLIAGLPAAALVVTGLTATLAPERAMAQTAPEVAVAPLTERAPDVVAMLDALRLYDILEIMATEGVEAAMSLEAEMFPDNGGAPWALEANRIHGAERMRTLFETAFPLDLMSDAHVAQVTAFFSAEPGTRIAAAEVAGRSAFLDPGLEELANDAFRDAITSQDPRLDLLTAFIQTNDLVERNVSGALNSNFSFYRGLSEGGAFEVEVPEELMLSEVWGQEPELRRDTIEWLYSFQLSAYSGLSDGDIEAYTALSETEAGAALNAALFAAFDAVFNQLSFELGVAAAGFIAGEDA
jgi:hypothetical protein